MTELSPDNPKSRRSSAAQTMQPKLPKKTQGGQATRNADQSLLEMNIVDGTIPEPIGLPKWPLSL